jgi:hypothetical protein
MANEIDYPAKYALEDGSGFYLLETGTDYYIKELQNYAELVRSDGANCYLRFDESSGNFVDTIGGRTGTPSGAAMTYAQAGALVDDPSTSLGLSATNQKIVVVGEAAFSPAANSNNLTIEMWANLSTMADSKTIGIARLNTTDWSMTLTTGGNTADGYQFNIQMFAAASAGTLENNNVFGFGGKSEWHLFTVVLDGSSSQTYTYFDGSICAFSPTPWGGSGIPMTWVSGDLEIALTFSTVSLGRFDEFALYPSALTAEQVSRHYRCGLQFLPDIPPPVMLAAH